METNIPDKKILQYASQYNPEEFVTVIEDILKQASMDKKSIADSMFQMGLMFYNNARFEHSIHVWAHTLEYYQIVGGKIEQANCYTNFGIAYYSLSKYQKAIEYHQKALEIFTEIGERSGEARCYINLGLAYYSLSQNQKALVYQQKALEISLDIGDRSDVASCYIGLGNTYESLSKYQKAIEYHQKALEIKLDIGDRCGEARCHGNLGAAYYSLGNYQKAIEYQQKALEISLDIKERSGEARCYGNLGLVYYLVSKYQKAIEYHQKALEIFTDISERSGEAICYINLGLAYHSLGNYPKAIEYFQNALEIFTDIGERSAEASCYGNLGDANNSLGNYPKAIEYQQKALEIKLDIGDRSGESRCYINLGAVYDSQGEYQKAIEYHQKALEIKLDIEDQSGVASCYMNLGAAYDSQGEYQKAIEYHQKALEIFTEIGERSGEASCYTNLGYGYFFQEQYPKAIEYYNKNIELSEKIGKDLVSEDQKISFYGQNTNTYNAIIKSFINVRDIKKAFEYAERAKSKSFVDLMSTSNIKIHSDDDHIKSLLEQEAILLARRKLLNMGAKPAVGEIDKIAIDLDGIYEILEKSGLGEYVLLRKPKAITLAEIQDHLKEKEILVEYYIIRDEILVFVLTPNTITLDNISSEQVSSYYTEFRKEVEKCSNKIEKDGFLPENEQIMKNLMDKLGELLLEPIRPHLSQTSIIYMVPHGFLHQVPLAALGIDSTPLIKTKPVSYLPSSSILQFLYKRKSTQFAKFAAFSSEFDDEAVQVAHLFGVEAYTKATKKKVLDELKKKHDILHFSCHGLFGSMLSEELQEKLTRVGKLKEKLEPVPLNSLLLLEDDILTAAEIFNLKMDASLVTLSACDTGQSEVSSGDDLVGLVRAILYSDASAVLVSLWPAEAEVSKDMMLALYNELKLDFPDTGIAKALQKAQKDTMESNVDSHPYLWAPFILVGNP